MQRSLKDYLIISLKGLAMGAETKKGEEKTVPPLAPVLSDENQSMKSKPRKKKNQHQNQNRCPVVNFLYLINLEYVCSNGCLR